MFNTMTMVKTAGALCGALLIFLLAGWAAREVYTTTPALDEAGNPVQAYVVDTGDDDAATSDSADAADEEEDFDAIYADADAAAGEKVFGKCKACHKIDGSNATGPHLDGVVDRPIASLDDFSYSTSLAEHGTNGEDWTPENLSDFLTSPKAFASNTKMNFAGLPKVKDRANLIAYLASLE